MEVPVAIVVEVVDAERSRPSPIDLVSNPQIRREVLANTLVGVAVDVAVVQRSVLRTAVARAERGGPLLVQPIADEGGRTPLRDVRLALADRVARHDAEAVVLL